ncbi:MAG: glycosyltransferase family 1 protein [Patescibacteria group bacterium]
MLIGIDCRMWQETGIGRYCREITQRLVALNTNDTFILFLTSKTIESDDALLNRLKDTPNVQIVLADYPWYTFSEQISFLIKLYSYKLDVVFFPQTNHPILYFRPFVVTVHDLTMLRVVTGRATTLPIYIYAFKLLAFLITVLSAMYRSKKVFVVSNYERDSYIRTFKISSERVVYTPNSIADEFKKVPSKDVIPVLSKYNIKPPYFFNVGNAYPHKNLPNLLLAFSKVVQEYPDIHLVLGGKTTVFHTKLKEYVEQHNIPNVIFTGFIADADLPAIYTGSLAYVAPSLYEGFGIFILEALACETPVLSSNATSLPEVGGSFAHYFDAHSSAEIETVLRDFISNPVKPPKDEVLQHLSQYSWDKSARTISNSLKSL